MNQPQRLVKRRIARRFLFMSMRDAGKVIYSFEMWSKVDLVRKRERREKREVVIVGDASFQSHPFSA